MNYTAKSRVALAADGKTLVAADTPEADTIFAGEGSVKPEAELEGKANVAKFFVKEGGEKAADSDVKTHSAPAASVRVEPEPSKSSAPAPTVKRK